MLVHEKSEVLNMKKMQMHTGCKPWLAREKYVRNYVYILNLHRKQVPQMYKYLTLVRAAGTH